MLQKSNTYSAASVSDNPARYARIKSKSLKSDTYIALFIIAKGLFFGNIRICRTILSFTHFV